MNAPNALTIARIALIPAFAFAFYLPIECAHPIAAVIFALACMTDWLDGYIARTYNQTTQLGAFLDPVADKLAVAAALVLVVSQRYMPYLSLPVAFIIGREIVVSALREWMAEIGKRTSVAVSFVGKVKTFSQMIALILLLAYAPGYAIAIKMTGYFLLYMAAILTIWSMCMYLKAAWPDLTLSAKKE